MKAVETTAHWLFAVFMTAFSFFIAMLLFLFVGLKLAGIPIGVKPAPEANLDVDPNLMYLYVAGSTNFTLMISCFVGVVTAPKAHRLIAAAVFPALVFLAFNSPFVLRASAHGFNIQPVLESAAGCATVGLFFYFKSRWQRSKETRAVSVVAPNDAANRPDAGAAPQNF
jgi:lysylphosphatidylglycerol synthetase-like protein (DUF2156 family)